MLSRGDFTHYVGGPRLLENTPVKRKYLIDWYVESNPNSGDTNFLGDDLNEDIVSNVDADIETFTFGPWTYLIFRGTIDFVENGTTLLDGTFFGYQFGTPRPGFDKGIKGSVNFTNGTKGSFHVTTTGRSAGLAVQWT